MEKIVDILSSHAFFHGLSSEDIEFISGCARIVNFKENQVIAHHGDKADYFYLILEGQAVISMEIPGKEPFIFNTLGPHDLLGWSWLIPPYEWTFLAQAMKATKAIEINGLCLRAKCENDPRLGYLLLQRLVSVLVSRIDAARLRLMDVFHDGNS